MDAKEMGVVWLRDRAATLDKAATAAENAYTKGQLAAVCTFVAGRYRKAASILRIAATDLEFDPEVLNAAPHPGEGETKP